MKRLSLFTLCFLLGALSLLVVPVHSQAADQEKEFNRILTLGMPELTKEAMTLLDSKYPDEDWDAYNFPSFVYTDDSVETGYKIAVKEPGLLRQFKCYCFCDVMGHANLSWCFLKQGDIKNGFDDHGSGCNICYGQAMMALLWQNAGIPPERMTQGFEKKFEQLIKKFGHK